MLTTPLATCVVLCATLAFLTWLLSVLTDEYSWVDRIWSIAPPVYVFVFWAHSGFADWRLGILTVLVGLWGARLTFNYARKGGYAPGGEDYRWAILKERLGPVGFHAFNATFISPYQNALILLMALPAATCFAHPTRLGWADAVLAVAFLGFLTLETVADQQQWDFHQAKQARREAGEPEPKGFLDTGLWAYCRHPNFLGELGQWWVAYGFAVAASGEPLHWTLTGAVLLTLLFHGSTAFTESITAAKYPAYADYQRAVGRLVPRPWRTASARPATVPVRTEG